MSQDTYETPFTLEALQSLESAIAQGIQTVKYSDKEIVYRSLNDMMRIRDLIRNKLGLDQPKSKKGFFGGKQKIGRHTKGLG